jgi:hypothetical protein
MAKPPNALLHGQWAGVDNAWEQGKLEAGKMLENATESHPSTSKIE